MNLKFLFLIIPSIFGYKKYNMNNFNNYNHLDKNNIKRLEKLEKLEKMFYLRHHKYSLSKNLIYMKYINKNITQNGTLPNNINELIKQFADSLEEKYKEDQDEDEDEDQYEDQDEDQDQDEDENIFNKTTTIRITNGYIDPFGIFRHNIPNGEQKFIPQENNAPSGDGTFEIIKNSKYSFKDVGGYEKIKLELLQSSDLLINPEKYQKYNVRVPKGIILEGPPGNGKTLLAKAFCGELNVSFIPVSGSEFSEMYVGVGAKRIRDLFSLASKNKPCVIFIDEIDALARKRGNDMVSSNSEKDQTLNQLLINLDGFKSLDGIFIMGATNRLDLLDPALTRPGRIDKNIYVGNPDSKTRSEIIKIHSNGKPINESVKNDYLVEITGGFSAAQIENLLNEAMLFALRENREIISYEDIEYITNRILSGWQSTENKYSDDIINRIVIHEIGHALVGLFSEEHANLVKITLNLWSPKTPGFTLFESNDENINIYTKNGLLSHLMVLFGGRVAEEIFYGYSVTTGAKKDLEQAFNLAQSMIVNYGMGQKTIYPDMSDQSKYLIDQEINKLLIEAHDNAYSILEKSKDLMNDCAVILKKNSILKPDEIIDIIKCKYPNILDTYSIKQ